MVTNNDEHPRNQALIRTNAGWRLTPAYDSVPAALLSQECRDRAMNVGRYGRTASLYKLMSHCEVFGRSREQADSEVRAMLDVVNGGKKRLAAHDVEPRTLEMLEGAILPASFFRTEPPQAP